MILEPDTTTEGETGRVEGQGNTRLLRLNSDAAVNQHETQRSTAGGALDGAGEGDAAAIRLLDATQLPDSGEILINFIIGNRCVK